MCRYGLKTVPIQYEIYSVGFDNPGGIFVMINGDIYVDSGYYNRVVKWLGYGTGSVIAMNVTVRCIALFIDMSNTLYCSMDNDHNVTKMLISNGGNIQKIAAGNGTFGSAANMLSSPNGIFVDSNLFLYASDWENNRIQRFSFNQTNGTTVVGSTASGTITLSGSTGVVLDSNGYFFIVDFWNNSVVGPGPYGFQCIAGCSSASRSLSTQLNCPRTLAFDSYGNIFVSNYNNNKCY